jgi:hypothetical protein
VLLLLVGVFSDENLDERPLLEELLVDFDALLSEVLSGSRRDSVGRVLGAFGILADCGSCVNRAELATR